MNKIIKFLSPSVPRPETLDEAWRLAELYGDVSVDNPSFGQRGYRAKIYGTTPAGSAMWAEGRSADVFDALCKAIDEAHNHGVRPR